VPRRPPPAAGPVPSAVAAALAGKRGIIIGASATVLLLAIGAFLWPRPSAPGVQGGAPATGVAGSDQPSGPGQGRPSTSSAPGREPEAPEKRIAQSPTGDARTDASPTGPRGDVGGPSTAIPTGAARGLKLLVPAYIYPSGEGRKEWQKLIDAAAKADIVVIANPNSGPGDDRDIAYHEVFTEAGKRGITLVGYVSTNYANRPQAEIKRDIDTWVQFYPQVRGFFFDQQPREGRYAEQFAELRDHARQRLRDPLVITNPGILCDEAYLAKNVSDVTCVFANYQGFDRFELPATFKPYKPSRFAAMPYNIAEVDTMRAFVAEAILKRIGYIYVSDAKPPNSWGKLPIYWQQEVDAVSRFR
jgi:hypothetical protein